MIQTTSHKVNDKFFYIETNLEGEVDLMMIEFASLFVEILKEMSKCGIPIEDAKDDLLKLCAHVYAKEFN